MSQMHPILVAEFPGQPSPSDPCASVQASTEYSCQGVGGKNSTVPVPWQGMLLCDGRMKPPRRRAAALPPAVPDYHGAQAYDRRAVESSDRERFEFAAPRGPGGVVEGLHKAGAPITLLQRLSGSLWRVGHGRVIRHLRPLVYVGL